MKTYLSLILIFCSSVKMLSQKSFAVEVENIEVDVLSKFLWELPYYTYVDRDIVGFNKPKHFVANYKRRLSRLKKSDSICRNSTDFNELRMSCPGSEKYSNYKSLFSEDDFEYILATYSKESHKRILNVECRFLH